MGKNSAPRMNEKQIRERLRKLYEECKELREVLEIGYPGEDLFHSGMNDGALAVIADGLGGATIMIVEGNYPVDFVTKRQRSFETEDAALEAASRLMNASIGEENTEGKKEDYEEVLGQIFV